MGVHELTLRNFRLFSEFVFVPDPHAVTVLISPNGTGKTSVLEAIYALATAASFRTSVASDMIRIHEPIADIHGVLFHFERRVQVDLTLTRGARGTTKRMLVNGQRPGSRAELSEVLPLTVFTPEGVDLVRGGPEHRRQFLTTLLTDVDPSAADSVERFHRVLAQRNALLRSLDATRSSPGEEGELELWSHELAEAGELLVMRREALLSQLTPLVAQFYEQLARGEDRVELTYEKSWTGPLAGALNGALRDDRYRGYTSVGPHRDDVRVLLSLPSTPPTLEPCLSRLAPLNFHPSPSPERAS